MRIFVNLHHAGSIVIDINSHSTLRQFKRLCQDEAGIDLEDMLLIHNGKCLVEDSRALRDLGFRSGDKVLLQDMSNDSSTLSLSSLLQRSYQVAPAKSPAAHKGFPNGSFQDPAHVRELLLSSPDQLALLKQNNPRLSEALHTGRLEPFAKVNF